MLRDAGASNLPPPDLLEALCRPRRPQLRDARVKALLAEWKKRGRPIEFVDLWKVAACIGVARPGAKTRRKIVVAVEAAGIEIRSYESLRKSLNETFAHVSLTGDAMFAFVEEAMWRRPEEWDSRPPPPPPPEWLTEWRLDREYGPTLERFMWQEKRRQGGPLWFLSRERAALAPWTR
jgi:hypothetical protein